MADLYKYGVAVHLYKPIIKRAVVDFAVSADWTPAAGDVKISKDGGAAANVTNLPTAITMGNTAMWDYSVTATEMQAKLVRITVSDAATKAVEDQMFEIDTYGNASAQHAVDLNDAVRAGLTALPNANAEAAGGLYTRGSGAGQINQAANGQVDTNVARWLNTAVSTPTVAGVPNVNAKTWNDLTTVALPLVPTAAGRTLDVSVGGEAGLDWANVGSPTTALALTGTTIAVTQKVDVDTIKTNPVVNAGTITFPTTATLASTTNITAGTITTVTTTTTATNLTNAPTAGDFTAVMKTSIGTAVAASAVASVTGNVGGNLLGTLSTTERAAVADAYLDRDMSTGTDSGSPTVRTPRQSLRFMRNKWSIAAGTLTVCKEDDTTTSWTGAVVTTAGNPVSSVDPA